MDYSTLILHFDALIHRFNSAFWSEHYNW